jgi:hypothetical protein
VNVDDALSRSSRPDQLTGLLERQGYDVEGALAALDGPKAPPQQPAAALAPQPAPVLPPRPQEVVTGLRMAGS